MSGLGNDRGAEGSKTGLAKTKKPKTSEWQEKLKKILQAHQNSSQSPAEMAIEAADSINKSPFTKAIMQVKKPSKFTVPKFVKFEGKTDPVEHIHQFQ